MAVRIEPYMECALDSLPDTPIILHPGREKSVLARHPWIFSGAVARFPEAANGSFARVADQRGNILGVGYFNRECSLAVRMLSFGSEAPPRVILRQRIEAACALRKKVLAPETSCERLINAEGDGIPGLIVDRYADVLVMQIGTLGIELVREWLVQELSDQLSPQAIYERSDSASRAEEGIPERIGPVVGTIPDRIEVTENGCRYFVDAERGQKTGFFIDQREMRSLVGALSSQLQVLNCFSYSGGFSVCAAAGGAARVVSVDSSARALELARENFALNRLEESIHECVRADVFDYLPGLEEKSFDLVILDPPALAKKRSHVIRAKKAYRTLNQHGLRLVRSGGLLLTSSCSYHLDESNFFQAVQAAARSIGRDIKVLQRHRHALDHPVSVFHPEGNYLKSLLLAVL